MTSTDWRGPASDDEGYRGTVGLLGADPAVTAVFAANDVMAVGALGAARAAAEEGALATTPLQARKGRASYLGERSIGHQDPGATSAALLIAALAETAGESDD